MIDPTIIVLIRFDEKEEYSKDTQKGKLFMHPVGKYPNLKEDIVNLRSDENEGICINYQPNKSKLYINNKLINSNDIISPITVTRKKDLYKYIYCMYAIYCKNNSISYKDLCIDRSVKNFGKSFLLIYNVREFFKRLDLKLNQLNIRYSRKLVEYKNLNSYHGKVTPFIKDRNDYSYQREYRIWLDYYKQKTFTLDIGDISDISYIGKTEELSNYKIKISEK